MQGGGFYEMYVYHNEETDEWYGSNLYELKDILRCNRITAKGTNKNERGDLPKMWGFPEAAFDTYCNILSDADLIVIGVLVENIQRNKARFRETVNFYNQNKFLEILLRLNSINYAHLIYIKPSCKIIFKIFFLFF